MIWTIFSKELRETVLDLRFALVTALCLVVVPLGMYVAGVDYQQRVSDYTAALQLAQKQNLTTPFVQAQGFLKPSPLSVFAQGLVGVMPEKAITYPPSPEASYNAPVGPELVRSGSVDSPLSQLFGGAGLLFSVSYVVSLAALIFTFSTVSGERESGTLRLMLSNAVPRWAILLGKMLGSYVALMIPFGLSLLAGVLLLQVTGAVPLLSGRLLGRDLVMLGVTLVFLLCMVNLGILGSVVTRRARSSMILLLFVWALLALALPRITPLVAKLLYPVESSQLIAMKQRAAKDDAWLHYTMAKNKLNDQCMREFGIPLTWRPTFDSKGQMKDLTDAESRALSAYDKGISDLKSEYAQRITSSVGSLEQDHENKSRIQTALAMNMARISPVSCYTFLLTDLSGTGLYELRKFRDRADLFQKQVTANVYDKMLIKSFGGASFGGGGGGAQMPTMDDYQNTTLQEAFSARWPDMLLLGIFTIAFFAISTVLFNRYDPR